MKLYLVKEERVNEIQTSEDQFLERDIEDFVQKNPQILLNEPILIFGRQVHTSAGKILDLLALDKLGRIIVIELKRGDAPRDMMAQILDYSAWLKKLPERELDKIARNYFEKNKLPYKTLHTAFEEFFKVKNAPIIGSELVNVLFAQNFSDELKNAIEYLSESGVPIYLLKFKWFNDKSGSKFIIIEKLTGEDEEQEEEDESRIQKPEQTKTISEKYSNRQFFNTIKKYFESNYLEIVNQYNAEWKGIFVHQNRRGDWTSVRSEWQIPEGFIQFAFGLLIRVDNKKFVSRIAYPKKLSIQNLDKLILSLNDNKYVLSEASSQNSYWRQHLPYVKILSETDANSNIDEGKLFKYVEEETPLLLRFINELLPKK